MSSMAKVLRVACKANKLGDSGSSAVLLKRLLAAGKKSASAAEKKPTSKKNVANKTGPKKKAPPSLFKGVKNGGMRLSASAYFKQVAGGKLYNCEPQWIR